MDLAAIDPERVRRMIHQAYRDAQWRSEADRRMRDHYRHPVALGM
jgi:hypothetical protein